MSINMKTVLGFLPVGLLFGACVMEGNVVGAVIALVVIPCFYFLPALARLRGPVAGQMTSTADGGTSTTAAVIENTLGSFSVERDVRHTTFSGRPMGMGTGKGMSPNVPAEDTITIILLEGDMHSQDVAELVAAASPQPEEHLLRFRVAGLKDTSAVHAMPLWEEACQVFDRVKAHRMIGTLHSEEPECTDLLYLVEPLPMPADSREHIDLSYPVDTDHPRVQILEDDPVYCFVYGENNRSVTHRVSRTDRVSSILAQAADDIRGFYEQEGCFYFGHGIEDLWFEGITIDDEAKEITFSIGS